MIPIREDGENEYDEINDFEIEIEPNLTYKLDTENNVIISKCDSAESIKQAIYMILSTERYDHLIYSWDYGIELKDLVGDHMPYVISEIQERIKEALMMDERIKNVSDFEVEIQKNKLYVIFIVHTTEGLIESEAEYNV